MASKQKRKTFPFSSLPDQEKKAVVKQMDCFSQFTLSVCDEVTGDFVKTCGLDCWNILVHFKKMCYIEVEFFDDSVAFIKFIRDTNRDYTKVQHDHVDVEMIDIYDDVLRYKCRKPSFTLRDWIKHVMAVFNREVVDVHYNKDAYCLDFIRDTFTGIKLNVIEMKPEENDPEPDESDAEADETDAEADGTDAEADETDQEPEENDPEPDETDAEPAENDPEPEENDAEEDETDADFRGYSILKCLPAPNILHPPLLSEQELSKILIQNFDILRPRKEQKLTLNHLLLNNSHYLESDRLEVTPKMLNRFIKLWRDGSNHRLRYLKLACSMSGRDALNIILDGVDNQKQQQERVFDRDRDHDDQMTVEVKKGYDIRSNDGKLATVKIYKDWFVPVFEMFIWV